MASNHELIRQAITEQAQVIATYKGKRREMCPHALGAKDGEGRALFFQFGGESSSGLEDGGQWRCLAVDQLEEIELIDGPWYTAATGHSRPQSCIEVVEAEVTA